jgi:hypothetical protein
MSQPSGNTVANLFTEPSAHPRELELAAKRLGPRW